MRHVEEFRIEGKIVEYSIVGQGEPILILHGGHSNCYEEFGYAELMKADYQLITPSRPGYGKTSPEWGSDLDAASNAYIKLLDHLGIGKIHVIAISAGGPSGLQLAASYPERVKSLILQSAVTKEWLTPKDKEYKAAHLIFRPSTEKHVWKMIGFMSNQFPRFIFKQMLSSFSHMKASEIWNHINDHDLDAFRKMNNRQRSGSGFLMDIKQTNQIKHFQLKSIKSPVLIMHSKNDAAVPIEHAYFAKENIPNAQLALLDTWGHLIWMGKGSSETTRKVIDFLKHKTLMVGD
ncbi:alpha/beta fold hydrolase [Fictibacillus barbaricus]|uniref:Pimeloyl-ACP methyl ester carboxylesterase n=1 Tax=Fictibacillus barbaricus TaxID=182136 RepID=A0ABU1TX09_9BACL|nr:alpha/beta hydrolase [Fictibacillus barbaricus]MDR7071727.1 pimeloyl-ACP methyl ester carboxylesterase [Fictibacillus barbaricus]